MHSEQNIKKVARMFFHYLERLGAETVLYNVQFVARLVSSSIKPCQLGESKLLLNCVEVRWTN